MEAKIILNIFTFYEHKYLTSNIIYLHYVVLICLEFIDRLDLLFSDEIITNKYLELYIDVQLRIFNYTVAYCLIS